jgi:hypothetical protein
MSIIKNYTKWLNESLGLTDEAATAAAPVTGSLLTDIVNSTAPFNKWSLSKAKPGFVLFPSWRLSPNKAEYWIPIDAYTFTKGKNSQGVESRVVATNYDETLDIFLPKGHPSNVNHSDMHLSGGPNDKSTEVNTYSYEGNPLPTERTLAEIGQKYPTNDDGSKWIAKSMVSNLGPNAVLKPTMQDRVDGFSAYAMMAEKDPNLTVDNYLAMLDAALPGAKALMATHLKSGSAVARNQYGPIGDKVKIDALIAKVKTLPEYAAAAGPAVAPGTKPVTKG